MSQGSWGNGGWGQDNAANPSGVPAGFGGGGASYGEPVSPPAVVPWEDSNLGWFTRWWKTTKEALFDTRNFFTTASSSEDIWMPVLYGVVTMALVGLAIGATVAIIYLVMGGIGAYSAGGFGGTGGKGGPGAVPIMAIMTAVGAFAIFIYPIMFAFQAFVAIFTIAGFQHITLMLFKGATRSFANTVRVVGYGHASQAWMCIPVVGYLLGWIPAIVFGLIVGTVGIDATHRCGTGKAFASVVLIPGILLLCCCGAYAAVIAAAVAQR